MKLSENDPVGSKEGDLAKKKLVSPGVLLSPLYEYSGNPGADPPCHLPPSQGNIGLEERAGAGHKAMWEGGCEWLSVDGEVQGLTVL